MPVRSASYKSKSSCSAARKRGLVESEERAQAAHAALAPADKALAGAAEAAAREQAGVEQLQAALERARVSDAAAARQRQGRVRELVRLGDENAKQQQRSRLRVGVVESAITMTTRKAGPRKR